MKNFILLFFVFFVFKVQGQTYTIKISYDASSDGCHAARYNWDFLGDNNSIDSFNSGGNSMNISSTKTYPNVPNYKKFKFHSITSCTPLRAVEGCESNDTLTVTSKKLLTGNYLGFGGCNGGGEVSYFKPNVTIRNLNTAAPNEICAGAQLDLAAFPAGFPGEAYHWQYSKDNQATWIDIPLTINGIPTNDIATTTVYMQQILGDSHTNYIGKQIYFRLGYGQTRNFTDALAITYMACAPVIESIVYKAPKCNGDAISQFDVTFDRPLKTELSEDIYIIKMKDVDNGIERNERQNITSIGTTSPYTYSFTNLDALEKGRTYRIVYQTRITDPADPSKKILKGFIESTQTFTYNEPPPLTFGLEGNNPICHNDTISITITANGGSGEYYYYSIDGGNPIRFTDKTKVSSSIVNGAVTEIRTGSQKIDLATSTKLEYDIIVTDGNNCIEKKISP